MCNNRFRRPGLIIGETMLVLFTSAFEISAKHELKPLRSIH